MTDWSDDDDLMAALHDAVAEADVVSDRRRTAAQAAFTWRSVDTELMDLLHDSALEAGAAVRSAGDTTRVLSFGRGALSLELEIDGNVVLGQLVPGQAGSMALQRAAGGDRTVETDNSGFFRFDGVEPGPARFVVTAGTQTLTTAWVTL